MHKMKEEVQEIFRDLFKKPDLVISSEMTANDIQGWDSITHMKLIHRIESHFRINFTYKQVRQLNNIGDLIRLIEEA